MSSNTNTPTLIFKKKFGIRRILPKDHEGVLECYLQGYQSNDLVKCAGITNEELAPQYRENIALSSQHPLSFVVVDLTKDEKVVGGWLFYDMVDSNNKLVYGSVEANSDEQDRDKLGGLDFVYSLFSDLINNAYNEGKLKKKSTTATVVIRPEYQGDRIFVYGSAFSELNSLYHQCYTGYVLMSTCKVQNFGDKFYPYNMIQELDVKNVQYKGKKIFAKNEMVCINLSEVAVDPSNIKVGQLLIEEFSSYLSEYIKQEGFTTHFYPSEDATQQPKL